MNSDPIPWTTLVVIASIAILTVVLRLLVANGEPVWLDELHTSWAVNGSIQEVAGRAADGNQPPLYFWLTWIPVQLLGHSEFSLRLVSIVCSVATLVSATWLVWIWTRSSIGAGTAAILIAIDVQFNFYGTEARPYALLQFLSVIQVILFCRAIWPNLKVAPKKPSREPFWWLAIVSAMLVYTHLTSVWLLVAEAIFFIGLVAFGSMPQSKSTKPQSSHQPMIGKFIMTAILIAGALVPATFQMKALFERKGNWQNMSSITDLMVEMRPSLLWMIAFPLCSLAVMNFLLPEIQRTSTLQRLNSKYPFVLTWALVPLVIVLILDYLDIAPMAMVRYVQVSAVAFPVFVGVCVGGFASRKAAIGISVLIVIVTALQNPLLTGWATDAPPYQFRPEDWKTPIAELNADVEKQHQPVFLFPNLIEDRDAFGKNDSRFQAYLQFPIGGLYEIENRERLFATGPTLELIHFKEEHIQHTIKKGGAWIIVRAHPDTVFEIGQEIRQRLALRLNKPADQIQMSVFEKQNSPVFLLSVDL